MILEMCVYIGFIRAILCFLFLFYAYGYHRDLHVLTHSFPTRRSSDLRLHHRSEIPMTRDEMMGLKPLDIIRHKTNADAFIVHRVSVDMLREGMAVTGHKIRVTAVRVIEEIGRAHV